MYSDSHIHLYDIFNATGSAPVLLPDQVLCASAHCESEFVWQESFARLWPSQVKLSFGIHPQEPGTSQTAFLEGLIADGRISAIGECGFDRYNEGYRADLERQENAWNLQLSIAHSSRLPLVIHCRKAMDLIFRDAKRLKGMKAVVFHGWPGSPREAESILERGINAFFSAGKGLLRGDRSLAETVATLPLDRLLTETDAPYMTLKGEKASIPADIRPVAAAASGIRGLEKDAFIEAVYRNFISAFGAFP